MSKSSRIKIRLVLEREQDLQKKILEKWSGIDLLLWWHKQEQEKDIQMTRDSKLKAFKEKGGKPFESGSEGLEYHLEAPVVEDAGQTAASQEILRG